MKLDFIPLDKLSVSRANMRFAKKPPDVFDILPTVRSRGVIQPVLVRASGDDGDYEIVAGSRRFRAASIVAEERIAAGETVEPMPCAILGDGDDAAAVEASLIENVARLDASEVAQWETFTRLIREGRSAEDTAATFGLTGLAVKRVLALGNLLPRIRRMYAREEIDRGTVRNLTLASRARQKEWLALADDENVYCPTGHQLKAWLFGGQSVPVAHALFDVEASGLATTADLFGEDRYFVDAEAFWTAQNAAIEARRTAFVEAGWTDAIVIGPDRYFSSWEYGKASKRKSGRVYLDVRASGEVTIHEGYIGYGEAARIARGETATADKPKRPEITSTMRGYIDLHRHAAVRAALTGHSQVALRLMVAHAIVGSQLWNLRPDPQATRNEAVRESVELSRAEADFDERRRAVLALLDFDGDAPTVTGGNGDEYGMVGLFLRLLDLPDTTLMEVIAIVMGETLMSGSAAVDAVGVKVGVDMADYWQADDAFFSLIRDKEILGRIVAEVAGESVAEANAKEKTKAMKTIVRDHLDGTNGRDKVERWVPRWMAFPPAAYTMRGGVGTVTASALVDAARDKARRLDHDSGPDGEPDPSAPDAVAAPLATDEPDTDGDAVPLAA